MVMFSTKIEKAAVSTILLMVSSEAHCADGLKLSVIEHKTQDTPVSMFHPSMGLQSKLDPIKNDLSYLNVISNPLIGSMEQAPYKKVQVENVNELTNLNHSASSAVDGGASGSTNITPEKMREHYKVLELDGSSATLDDIKKAYRRLALMYHPDKSKTIGDAQKAENLKNFIGVDRAYKALILSVSADKAKQFIRDSGVENISELQTQGEIHMNDFNVSSSSARQAAAARIQARIRGNLAREQVETRVAAGEGGAAAEVHAESVAGFARTDEKRVFDIEEYAFITKNRRESCVHAFRRPKSEPERQADPAATRIQPRVRGKRAARITNKLNDIRRKVKYELWDRLSSGERKSFYGILIFLGCLIIGIVRVYTV